MWCEICGERLQRVHRQGLGEKIRYRVKYECRSCQTTHLILRPSLEWLSWHFSLVSHCPKCGTDDVTQSKKRDGIDRLYKNPWSLLQALLGAPIKHCHFCRLQYYDFRPRAKVIRRPGATFVPPAAARKRQQGAGGSG